MKNRIIACITAALLVLTGASVWEGAASIAPLGDLPGDGFYAATNSFPRNTVVDVTNLETGQSIRVIVVTGLETPGLLAVLSQDAAEKIGIRSRSIGRIRMTQPSDPVAFARFTEGLDSSGDPDYDPRALVNADPLAQSYTQSPAAPLTENPSVPEPAAGDTGAGSAESIDPWYDEIVDIPDYFSPSAASETDEGIAREETPVYVPEEESPAAAYDPWASPSGGETAEAEEPEAPETNQPPRWEDEPGLNIAEEPNVSSIDEDEPAEPQAVTARPEPDGEGEYEYGFVPAEERPPEASPVYEIPPELVIAPIPEGTFVEPKAESEPVMDESLFVDPLGNAPPASTALIPETPPVHPLPDIFSVPMISSLERGKYYLQIGAFNRTESVESMIGKVGNGYPLAVQNGGTAEKPLYRLLIGPVNLGESGALLQRFKSIGYGDVFVRSGS
ncbi:MAG: SPOR domain-containing protein [Treponema sp.]|jgi:cell division septation protein DedD|nr:SPOR domain-containing protein [Treponema sp.]